MTTDLPYTVLSCAVSMDGYIDDVSPGRLILSNDDDRDRVDAVRAECDAILVGAGTVRNDNPRLLVRSRRRVHDRIAAGRTPTPIKVTVTERAKLDPRADFFAAGETDKLVFCASERFAEARDALAGVATVIDGGQPLVMRRVSANLHARGVRRLLVEGGGSVHTQFLTAGLADELHLAVAPFFVGDSRARRFVDDGRFPWDPGRRASVVEVRGIGDVVLVRYALSARCDPA